MTLFKLPIIDDRDECHMLEIHKACYNLLHTYMTACSKKNALYFAKYFTFFQSQMKVSEIF
ncbi:hypothetical protein LSH36_859g02032 [Paralvinella palmiformis]|uniref:Uncharacterized protein n=1 Tax=Paralvinella palmiformis TaxID=53620 RepID=A0AAD9MRN9_9ANNE|nr:hypothetical protein LSH36_859g02032 [Paralvinella palmiformis]